MQFGGNKLSNLEKLRDRLQQRRSEIRSRIGTGRGLFKQQLPILGIIGLKQLGQGRLMNKIQVAMRRSPSAIGRIPTPTRQKEDEDKKRR
jgi:hypothetical protein